MTSWTRLHQSGAQRLLTRETQPATGKAGSPAALLSTATAIIAMSLADRERNANAVRDGLEWLAATNAKTAVGANGAEHQQHQHDGAGLGGLRGWRGKARSGISRRGLAREPPEVWNHVLSPTPSPGATAKIGRSQSRYLTVLALAGKLGDDGWRQCPAAVRTRGVSATLVSRISGFRW